MHFAICWMQQLARCHWVHCIMACRLALLCQSSAAMLMGSFRPCAGWQVPYGFHSVFITEQELASQLPS